jgi:hypothetical protein
LIVTTQMDRAVVADLDELARRMGDEFGFVVSRADAVRALVARGLRAELACREIATAGVTP